MEAPNIEVDEIPQTTTNIPKRLQKSELVNDNEVTKECDLVHMALMAYVDPINHHEDLMNKEWKNAMKEELTVS